MREEVQIFININTMDNLMFRVAKKQTKHAGKIRDVIIGRVYKLINTRDDMIYIGSTT